MIGLVVMQLAYAFTITLYDHGVDASLAGRLMENLVLPLIKLLETLAAAFFIAMAIYAFYRIVTANGNDEAVKSGKMTIVYAIIGFMVVKLAAYIVAAFYGSVWCNQTGGGIIASEGSCMKIANISQGASIIINIINWLNSFVAIAVMIMIIYAGAQILLSQGDEEKVSKWKKAIIYIAIGIIILAINYLILTLFLRPDGVSL